MRGAPSDRSRKPGRTTSAGVRITSSLQIERGSPLPFGAVQRRNGVNFALFSRHATGVCLVLFEPGAETAMHEIVLDPVHHRTGDVWHIFIAGLELPFEYNYRVNRQPNDAPARNRFDPSQLLLDPYSRAVPGGEEWGVRPGARTRRSTLIYDHFDWEDDRPLNISLADSVIYELHVRGFTRHPSSGVSSPGTYLGLTEKIPYLKDLGVTAVELLPVYEFEEANADRRNPLTGEPLLNYWGYQPIGFFAPNLSYASGGTPADRIREFKEMVKRFHAAGIEVILDVVFNHTAEGDQRGPTYSFRGIDNTVYYIVNPHTGEYENYSGCGNSVNCNHPVVRDMIVSCLRYWAMEMHVDGFRFDLASILGRGTDGSLLANPPLLESLAFDPILANTKLIAEAWDAAGVYQVGTFPAWGRWAEWNGKFRDDLRRFVKSDSGVAQALALRMIGSPDLYKPSGRQAYHSINFVTCHDGFTLADLVTYNEKHNEANGEGNVDGDSVNYSWNCGEEGPTSSPEIASLRLRQQKNLASLLLLAGGVPMLLAGDEFGRTQRGNNNAYCQDNEISWVDWTLAKKNAGLHRFFKFLIGFRRKHPALRRVRWPFDDSEHTRVEFHGVELGRPDWSEDSRSLAIHLSSPARQGARDCVYLIANAYWRPIEFALPPPAAGKWVRFVDTSLDSPLDAVDPETERYLDSQNRYTAGPRSVVVLVSR
jgi:isoamylase